MAQRFSTQEIEWIAAFEFHDGLMAQFHPSLRSHGDSAAALLVGAKVRVARSGIEVSREDGALYCKCSWNAVADIQQHRSGRADPDAAAARLIREYPAATTITFIFKDGALRVVALPGEALASAILKAVQICALHATDDEDRIQPVRLAPDAFAATAEPTSGGRLPTAREGPVGLHAGFAAPQSVGGPHPALPVAASPLLDKKALSTAHSTATPAWRPTTERDAYSTVTTRPPSDTRGTSADLRQEERQLIGKIRAQSEAMRQEIRPRTPTPSTASVSPSVRGVSQQSALHHLHDHSQSAAEHPDEAPRASLSDIEAARRRRAAANRRSGSAATVREDPTPDDYRGTSTARLEAEALAARLSTSIDAQRHRIVEGDALIARIRRQIETAELTPVTDHTTAVNGGRGGLISPETPEQPEPMMPSIAAQRLARSSMGFAASDGVDLLARLDAEAARLDRAAARSGIRPPEAVSSQLQSQLPSQSPVPARSDVGMEVTHKGAGDGEALLALRERHAATKESKGASVQPDTPRLDTRSAPLAGVTLEKISADVESTGFAETAAPSLPSPGSASSAPHPTRVAPVDSAGAGTRGASPATTTGVTSLPSTPAVSTQQLTQSAEAGAMVPPATAAGNTPKPANLRVLGAWKELWSDQSAKVYYYNTSTKKTTWRIEDTPFAVPAVPPKGQLAPVSTPSVQVGPAPDSSSSSTPAVSTQQLTQSAEAGAMVPPATAAGRLVPALPAAAKPTPGEPESMPSSISAADTPSRGAAPLSTLRIGTPNVETPGAISNATDGLEQPTARSSGGLTLAEPPARSRERLAQDVEAVTLAPRETLTTPQFPTPTPVAPPVSSAVSDIQSTVTTTAVTSHAAPATTPSAPAPNQQDATAPQRKGDWLRKWDATTGRFYYKNAKTSQTTWSTKGTPFETTELTVVMVPEAHEPVLDETPANRETVRNGDWVRRYDQAKGKYYYGNTVTGGVQWSAAGTTFDPAVKAGTDERPTVARDVVEHPHNRTAASPVKRGGWTQKFDVATQRHYYTNKEQGVQQWSAKGTPFEETA